MKALILAAGYGTRLARELAACPDQYTDLLGVPKPLLPVAGHPLISHWIHILKACREVTDIYIVVNAKYYKQFEAWREKFPQVGLVCDGTSSNDERLGAVACIQVAVKHFSIQDSLMVIGGDTLFCEDFSLSTFINKFKQGPAEKEGGTLVSCYRCKEQEINKFGIVEVDVHGKITSFLEKPLPSATTSRLASHGNYRDYFFLVVSCNIQQMVELLLQAYCPCFYIFSQESLVLLEQFIKDKENSPLKEKDATGHFVKYLSERNPVYTEEVSGRFDIGGLQSYLECCRLYKPVIRA